MALNYPGPYDVRIFYSTQPSGGLLIDHVQKLNVQLSAVPSVGAAFNTITPVFRTTPAGPTDLAAIVDLWVVSMKAMLNNGAGNIINRAELWKYTAGTFDASFVSSYTISVAGTSATAVVQAGQAIVTMRTDAGGVFKLNFMETVIPQGVTDPGTISNAALDTLVTGIEGNYYPWIGRDGGYPRTRIAHYPGVNEALFKKRFRP